MILLLCFEKKPNQKKKKLDTYERKFARKGCHREALSKEAAVLGVRGVPWLMHKDTILGPSDLRHYIYDEMQWGYGAAKRDSSCLLLIIEISEPTISK